MEKTQIFGELLFHVVELAYIFKIDPETALRKVNLEFIKKNNDRKDFQ